MSEATPRPWTKEYDNDTGPNDESFREFWTVASGRFDNEADADLALKAVNRDYLFERLVGLLKMAGECIDPPYISRSPLGDKIRTLLAEATDASRQDAVDKPQN